MMGLRYNLLASSLFKASGVYILTSIFNSSIPFLLIPILTRYISPEDYGMIYMFSIFLSVLNVFTGLGTHGAVNRVYFEKNVRFKLYITNTIYILLITSLMTFAVIYIFKEFLSQTLGIPKKWLILGVFISCFQFFILTHLIIYQASVQPYKYSLYQISQGLLNFFTTILFIAFLKLGGEGRLLSQLLILTLFGFLSFKFLYYNYFEWKLDLSYIKHALEFSLPLVPHTIGAMLITYTDRIIITNELGLKETGLYTVSMQICSIILVLGDAFNKAYVPWLFNKLNTGDIYTKIKIVRYTYIHSLGVIFLSIVFYSLIVFCGNILLGNEFQIKEDVIFWIILGNVFGTVYYMFTNYIFYAYKTKILTFITFICGVLNVPLTLFLVRENGIVGAAQSYAIVYILFFCLVWLSAVKVYNMPWFDFNLILKKTY